MKIRVYRTIVGVVEVPDDLLGKTWGNGYQREAGDELTNSEADKVSDYLDKNDAWPEYEGASIVDGENEMTIGEVDE